MNELPEYLTQSSPVEAEKPEIFDLSDPDDEARVKKLCDEHKIQHVVDNFEEDSLDHFETSHPEQIFQPGFPEKRAQYVAELKRGKPLWQQGKWAYYPWSSTVVHILEHAAFQRVRTARNQNLITQEEQKKFYDAVIGVAGLSVGSSIALAIVLQGGARHIKIVDHDRLALSNTNRIRAGVEFLGLSKAIMTARQIYALNPYAIVDVFPEGLSDANIAAFLSGLDVVVDEIDNLAVKYRIRENAKQKHLPLVTAADNGDGVVLDIERYDLNPQPEFFHGRMGDVSYDDLAKLDKRGIGKLITKWVGAENVPERMQQSLREIGETIVSWPQLGGAALTAGALIAYCVRRIVNGQPLESNRAIVSFDEKLIPGFLGQAEQKKRTIASDEFRRAFGL